MEIVGMNDQQTYSNTAVRLHWLIGLLIIGNLIGGLAHDAFPKDMIPTVMGLHKATGILILVLSLFRLYWRLTHRPPSSAAGLKGWEIGLSHLTHWGFYLLMILIPVSGWWMSSVGAFTPEGPKRWPISFFGLFDVPFLPVARTEAAGDFWHEAHEITAFVMIGLLVLHIAGAIKHQFDGHPVLHRMLPFMNR